jgi:CheY-like chemotaxis protein
MGGKFLLEILLVDDDAGILEVTRRFLERDGDMHVTAVQSGEEALDLLSRDLFDAIVADYLMGGCDGIAVLKAVRGGRCLTAADAVFIILTGKSRERIAIDALNAGADFYLRKGRRPGEMLATLRLSILAGIERRGQPGGADGAAPGAAKGDHGIDPLINRFTESRDGVIIASTGGRILFMNSPAVTLLGLPLPEAGIGRQLPDLVPDATGDLSLMNRLSTGLITKYRLPRGAPKAEATTRLSRVTFRQENAVLLEMRS